MSRNASAPQPLQAAPGLFSLTRGKPARPFLLLAPSETACGHQTGPAPEQQQQRSSGDIRGGWRRRRRRRCGLLRCHTCTRPRALSWRSSSAETKVASAPPPPPASSAAAGLAEEAAPPPPLPAALLDSRSLTMLRPRFCSRMGAGEGVPWQSSFYSPPPPHHRTRLEVLAPMTMPPSPSPPPSQDAPGGTRAAAWPWAGGPPRRGGCTGGRGARRPRACRRAAARTHGEGSGGGVKQGEGGRKRSPICLPPSPYEGVQARAVVLQELQPGHGPQGHGVGCTRRRGPPLAPPVPLFLALVCCWRRTTSSMVARTGSSECWFRKDCGGRRRRREGGWEGGLG